MPARPMQFHALAGWRGIAALLVALFHLPVAHSLYQHEWLHRLSPGLEFFFLISGFIMAMGYSERINDGRTFIAFLVRRAGRVWPLQLAMIGLLLWIPLIGLLIGSPQPFRTWAALNALPYHLLLLQTWWPDSALLWNYPAWTLTGEIFAYFLMALLVLGAQKEWMRWLLGLTITTIAVTIYYHEMLSQAHQNTVSVSRAVTGFFIGFLLYHFWRRLPLKNPVVGTFLEIATVVGFIAIVRLHPTGLSYFWVHALFVLGIYTYASDLGFVSRVLTWPIFQWLGNISFSIYMWHGVVTIWMLTVAISAEKRISQALTADVLSPVGQTMRVIRLPQQWMSDALSLSYFVVVIVGATLVYRWCEQPGRLYFSGLSNRILTPGASHR
jgi:peptidoglycan/LPS O-acetylase OafA/YrhL